MEMERVQKVWQDSTNFRERVKDECDEIGLKTEFEQLKNLIDEQIEKLVTNYFKLGYELKAWGVGYDLKIAIANYRKYYFSIFDFLVNLMEGIELTRAYFLVDSVNTLKIAIFQTDNSPVYADLVDTYKKVYGDVLWDWILALGEKRPNIARRMENLQKLARAHPPTPPPSKQQACVIQAQHTNPYKCIL
jgi:hypothetical protein